MDKIKFIEAGTWRQSPNAGEIVEVNAGDVIEASPSLASLAVSSGKAEYFSEAKEQKEQPQESKKPNKKRKLPGLNDKSLGEYEG